MEGERYRCADCNRKSPATNTDYTLISKEHGWRLSRKVSADGVYSVEWRCPVCWAQFKKDGPAGAAKQNFFKKTMALLRTKRSEPPPRQ